MILPILAEISGWNSSTNLTLLLFTYLGKLWEEIPEMCTSKILPCGGNVVRQKKRGKCYQEHMIGLVDQGLQGKKRT